MHLKTKRLYLRPLVKQDAMELFGYRSDSITNKYQGWVPKNLEDTYQFIAKIASKIDTVNTWFQVAIVAKDSDKLVGDLGIHFLDADKKQVEIGITLAKEHQGKGFATEALKETIHFIFNTLNKHRITGSVDPNNINSRKLLEGLGFRKEAHFVESLYFNGKWVDDIVYATLKKEWK